MEFYFHPDWPSWNISLPKAIWLHRLGAESIFAVPALIFHPHTQIWVSAKPSACTLQQHCFFSWKNPPQKLQTEFSVGFNDVKLGLWRVTQAGIWLSLMLWLGLCVDVCGDYWWRDVCVTCGRSEIIPMDCRHTAPTLTRWVPNEWENLLKWANVKNWRKSERYRTRTMW